MTGFTSGKRHKDPTPWLGDPGHTNTPNRYGSRETGEGSPFWDEVRFVPRNEYDNHNPILVWLRAASEDKVLRATYGAGLTPLLASDFLVPGALEGHSPEQIDHARRVLTKLAALTTTTRDECECIDPFTASLTGHGHACPLYNEED